MTVEIILWSDYVSPYAYVAKAWAYRLEADYAVALRWQPYTLDIASYMGSVEGRDPHHWRPGRPNAARDRVGRSRSGRA